MAESTTVAGAFVGYVEAWYKHDVEMAQIGINYYRDFLAQQGMDAPEPPEEVLAEGFRQMRLAIDALTEEIAKFDVGIRAIRPPEQGRLQ